MPFKDSKAREAFFAQREKSPGPNSGIPFQGNKAPAISTMTPAMKSLTNTPVIKPFSSGINSSRFGQLTGFLKKNNPQY